MKLLDLRIHDDILEIVDEEVTRIRAAGDERTQADMLVLEKATKIFTMLQANLREAMKAGSFGNMSDDELNQSQDLESAVDGSDSDDNL